MTPTDKLILERPKALQGKVTDVASDVHDIKTDLRAVKGHMASFMQSEVAQDGYIAALQKRIERIERQFELRD